MSGGMNGATGKKRAEAQDKKRGRRGGGRGGADREDDDPNYINTRLVEPKSRVWKELDPLLVRTYKEKRCSLKV